jgi:hypothetical protein
MEVSYNATNSLVRFESKNIFFYFGKHPGTYILLPFGIYFIFSRFGSLYQEKSGNPVINRAQNRSVSARVRARAAQRPPQGRHEGAGRRVRQRLPHRVLCPHGDL